MSKLLQRIQADQLKARKEKKKVKATLLTTLLGEATPGGNGVVNDTQVQATIAKFAKLNKQAQEHSHNDPVLVEELAILQAYQPDELKGVDLEKFIGTVIAQVHATSMRDMGKIMGKLKNAPYTIDMKVAQSLIKKAFI
mgnify:CR=1 FL=1